MSVAMILLLIQSAAEQIPKIMDSQTITLALIAVIYALVEALKWNQRRSHNPGGFFTGDDRRLLSELHELHRAKDQNGTPLWYVPRRMLEVQNEQLKMLNQIVVLQKQVLSELERSK